MKKIFIAILILLTGCSTSIKTQDSKNLDGEIVIAVENTEFGDDFVSLWNKLYPENANAISYVVYTDFDSEEFTTKYSDISLLWDVYAAGLQTSLLPIDVTNYRQQLIGQYLLHTQNLKYVPISAIGSFFIVNKTLLDENNIDVTDGNNDGLIDAVDSFEKIAALNFDVKMHYDIDDQYSGLFLFSNGFKLFDDSDKNNPGFLSEEFSDALTSSLQLKKIVTLSDFVYPNDLAEGTVPFIIGLPTFMIAKESEAINMEYCVSKFPTLNDKEFYPNASSKGYVINSECKYPDLAKEVLNVLESQTGLQLYLDDTDSNLLYKGDFELNYGNNIDKEISKAYTYSYPNSFYGYGEDKSKTVTDLLENIDYYTTLKNVFNEEIGIDEAISSLNVNAKEWINNVDN